MLHILIDGYNLIAKLTGMGRSLEVLREELIRVLGNYLRRKPFSITVVFDGEKGGFPVESYERVMGIDIVFSKLGEKADEVIKRMARKHEMEYTVITSDKEIASFVESLGHTAIPSEEFIPKLLNRGYGKDHIEDEGPGIYKRFSTRKKGNPHKLSKAEKRRRQRLQKL